jgi:DegV family protein with EDD domain
MPRVAIVTDTTACIPAPMAAELGIDVLPLFLAFGDSVYQDGMSERSAEFYQALRNAPSPPTTSAPAPGDYAEAYIRAGRRAETVLCLTVSRQFSAMHEAAMQGVALAKEREPSLNVRVLDSGAAAMAQGFVVLQAARAAAAGASLHEAVEAAEALQPRVQLLVVLDTLTYLARSGRVPKLVVWGASPLQLKPIVSFHKGSYRPVTIVRTMPRAVERLYQELSRRGAGGKLHVCVHHTNVPAQAEELLVRLREDLKPEEVFVSEFTQVMGTHTGPRLLGFAFYTEP